MTLSNNCGVKPASSNDQQGYENCSRDIRYSTEFLHHLRNFVYLIDTISSAFNLNVVIAVEIDTSGNMFFE